ncbi:uncharacterized protein LOC111102424 isoform X3 [Crassostrea virginica]
MRFMLLCVVYGLLFYCEQTDSCITLWNPVCGVDGKTYSNACFVPRRVLIACRRECPCQFG